MTYPSILKALADPTRREILEALRGQPTPVGRLARDLPVSRPAVSQHLKVLKDANLVQERREGTRRIYSVDYAGIEVLRQYLDGYFPPEAANETSSGEELPAGEPDDLGSAFTVERRGPAIDSANRVGADSLRSEAQLNGAANGADG